MHEKSDLQLLREYAEGSEADFRELVERHTDFVYSAALRQVESSDIACDIAQSVFTDIARKAKSLSQKTAANSSLAGWLHRSTRYAALNHLRDSRRRLANERQAMEQLLTDSESSADWERIRPALDEALDSLSDEDREALLLRYFKNQDFRAVGHALGVSDDAAQKRVSRAVERLREFFSKRGITVGASGVAVLISANAVQSAPVGLALAVSNAATIAGTAAATSTVITATKAIAMTTLQKTLITATIAALASAGIYEAHENSKLRDENQLQRQQIAQLKLESERPETVETKSPSDQHLSELLQLRSEVGTLRHKTNELAQVQPQAPAPQATPPPPESQETKEARQHATQMVMIATIFFKDGDNINLTNLNQFKNLPPGAVQEDFILNLNKFEIVSNPSPVKWNYPDVILLRERTPRLTSDGKWARVYGMVDGQALEQISTDGNFDAWEKEHLMPAGNAP